MKVVLFCGGLGTRLREHSETIPKPLVNVGIRPIVWHLMRYYAHYGHKDFVLCLGYRGDLIREYFRNYDECLSNDFTMSNGGHAYADQMLICQHVEQAGIATVLGVDEYSDTDGSDFPLVTYVPEASAIVSVGNQEQIIQLPPMSRVLGGERFLAGNDYEKGFEKQPHEAFPVGLRQIYASTCQLGYTTHRGRAY